jgi:hypothetical protein
MDSIAPLPSCALAAARGSSSVGKCGSSRDSVLCISGCAHFPITVAAVTVQLLCSQPSFGSSQVMSICFIDCFHNVAQRVAASSRGRTCGSSSGGSVSVNGSRDGGLCTGACTQSPITVAAVTAQCSAHSPCYKPKEVGVLHGLLPKLFLLQPCHVCCLLCCAVCRLWATRAMSALSASTAQSTPTSCACLSGTPADG